MGRTTTAQYRQSMHAQVRKVTNPSITLTYTGASNYYFNNTKIISLKRTQTVDILGRSLPTETLTWVARMPSDYNIKNPSGTYGAVKTGATALINFLQVLQDGTITHGCGTASNYMDTFRITNVTRDQKTGLYSFMAKSRLTIANATYKSNYTSIDLVRILSSVMTEIGGTYEHDISSTYGSFTVESNGIEQKVALQRIAQATGRALYTYDNKIMLKQWDLTANPSTYISKKDYYQNGIEITENDRLKTLTIQGITREHQYANPYFDSKAVAYRQIGTLGASQTATFYVQYDNGKEYDVEPIAPAIYFHSEDVYLVDISVDMFGIYSIRITAQNRGSSLTDVYVTVYGTQPTYIKSDITYTTGNTTGQDITISNNSWITPTQASALQSRYTTVYGKTTQMRVKYRGLQEIYCGDIIAIEDETGTWQKVVVTSAILDYDGALSGELVGLVLGTTTAPILRKTVNRAIVDVDSDELVLADLRAYRTSYTATQIDDFITKMLGS